MGGGAGGLGPTRGKLHGQVDICFCTDAPKKAIGPSGPTASLGRFVQLSVKYVDD